MKMAYTPASVFAPKLVRAQAQSARILLKDLLSNTVGLFLIFKVYILSFRPAHKRSALSGEKSIIHYQHR